MPGQDRITLALDEYTVSIVRSETTECPKCFQRSEDQRHLIPATTTKQASNVRRRSNLLTWRAETLYYIDLPHSPFSSSVSQSPSHPPNTQHQTHHKIQTMNFFTTLIALAYAAIMATAQDNCCPGKGCGLCLPGEHMDCRTVR